MRLLGGILLVVAAALLLDGWYVYVYTNKGIVDAMMFSAYFLATLIFNVNEYRNNARKLRSYDEDPRV